MSTRTCLVVSDGRRGIENQALGLAEALADRTPLQIETLHLPRSGAVPPLTTNADVWIGCGRAAVRAAAAHKRALPEAKFVYVQDPRAEHALFDLIIAPRHDRLSGPNVLNLVGSPNRVTPERLSEGARAFRDRLASLPGPRMTVLIGGDSKHHTFTPETCDYLLRALERVRAQVGSLMITVSRRSPEPFIKAIEDHVRRDAGVWYHDGSGDNPYFAFLEAADFIAVTEDSTNMLCEAASTGKPVYRLGVDGKPGKFERLYAQLEGVAAVRPFLGKVEAWSYPPLHETARAADAVLEILPSGTNL